MKVCKIQMLAYIATKNYVLCCSLFFYWSSKVGQKKKQQNEKFKRNAQSQLIFKYHVQLHILSITANNKCKKNNVYLRKIVDNPRYSDQTAIYYIFYYKYFVYKLNLCMYIYIMEHIYGYDISKHRNNILINFLSCKSFH